MDRIERTFFAASTILILFIALPATAQVRIPYKLPEMIELEPTFESEIVVPNFTVLELNGAYEISIGANLDLVTGAAGFDYEVDMEAETYTISALDPMDVVAGPLGFTLSEREAIALQSGGSFQRSVPGMQAWAAQSDSTSSNCGRLLSVYLWVKAITRDPIFIELARTTQSANWSTNSCRTRLNSVNRTYWANSNTIFFNTHWYRVSKRESQSIMRVWYLNSGTSAETWAKYRNDDFMRDDRPTFATHEIEFFLEKTHTFYHDFTATHTGEFWPFLHGSFQRVLNVN